MLLVIVETISYSKCSQNIYCWLHIFCNSESKTGVCIEMQGIRECKQLRESQNNTCWSQACMVTIWSHLTLVWRWDFHTHWWAGILSSPFSSVCLSFLSKQNSQECCINRKLSKKVYYCEQKKAWEKNEAKADSWLPPLTDNITWKKRKRGLTSKL